jgi:hypothetical protein
MLQAGSRSSSKCELKNYSVARIIESLNTLLELATILTQRLAG